MIALIAAVCLVPQEPKLGIESWMRHLEPKTKAAALARDKFLEQIRARQWEGAFESGKAAIAPEPWDPYMRVQHEARLYELLLIADRPDLVLKLTEPYLKPAQPYKGKQIRRPKDYAELLTDSNPDGKEIVEKYAMWGMCYGTVLEAHERASAMAGDFRRAIWALEEREQLPSMHPPRAHDAFGSRARKMIWRTAMEDPRRLRSYARGAFVPLEELQVEADYQIEYVSRWATWTEMVRASNPEAGKDAAKRLKAIMLKDGLHVNEEILMYFMADEPLRG